MFENAINSKKQGDIGMCYAIAYFSKLGYTISIPITDSQDYDLIIDNGIKLLKVQVKTTKFKRYNSYQVALKTSGGNKSQNNIKTFDFNSSDLLFILVDNGDMYCIPTSTISNKHSLNLDNSQIKFKVNI